MSDAPLIVGVSGLRGIVGESLTPGVAAKYAGAFGAWLNERVCGAQPAIEPGPAFRRWPERRSSARVIVAFDGRAGGESILKSAIEGLLASGCDVLDIGKQMTPTVGVVVDKEAADGAIIITASHNPQRWNGLKALFRGRVSGGTPVAAAPCLNDANAIISVFGHADTPAAERQGRRGEYGDALADHLVVLDAALKRSGFGGVNGLADGVRVAADSVNASGVLPTGALVERVGGEVVAHIGGDDSGIFPHTPEPTAENLSGEGGLCDVVPGLKADVGFAQDPDADRLAIVDENGRYIGEEYTLALCAESLLMGRCEATEASSHEAREGGGDDGLEARPTSGNGEAVLVANLSTSRMIDDVAARYGARVVRTPVGEANVVEVMKKLKAEGQDVLLGGEGNGGVIWPEVVYVRDSLSSMALVLSLMARTGKAVSELVEQIDSYSSGGKGYAIVKRKTEIGCKADAGSAVKKVAGFYGGGGETGWKPAPPGGGGDGLEAHPTRQEREGREGRNDGLEAHPTEMGRTKIDLQDGVRVDFPERGIWVHVRASNTEPIMRLIAEAPTRAEAVGVLEEVEQVIRG